ncbi:MAG: SdiA-regulated domain-containing protein [Chitinophagaceae bacterium]
MQANSVEVSAKGPQSYDLVSVDKQFFKKKLKEISGIHFLAEPDQFVAIQDEQGIIYTINYQNGEVVAELPFAGSGDYEDITMDANYYYVLESRGRIYQVPKNGSGAGTRVFNLPGGRNNFESIYLDAKAENLILICKECADEAKANAYTFNISKQQFNEAPLFKISNPGLIKAAGDKSNVFRPSAAAIHPIEKKLYVLCSVGRLLLICDLQGNVEHLFHLDPTLYKQPEGIAFKPNGDLFIANEAAGDKANILKLKYLPK